MKKKIYAVLLLTAVCAGSGVFAQSSAPKENLEKYYTLERIRSKSGWLVSDNAAGLMLNQASGDRQILARQLNISPHQLSYVTNSGEGEGLVFYGSTIIPFKDKFDNSLMLYALMTSKPDEVEKRKKLGIGERDD